VFIHIELNHRAVHAHHHSVHFAVYEELIIRVDAARSESSQFCRLRHTHTFVLYCVWSSNTCTFLILKWTAFVLHMACCTVLYTQLYFRLSPCSLFISYLCLLDVCHQNIRQVAHVNTQNYCTAPQNFRCALVYSLDVGYGSIKNFLPLTCGTV